jgi:hypothetical protein
MTLLHYSILSFYSIQSEKLSIIDNIVRYGKYMKNRNMYDTANNLTIFYHFKNKEKICIIRPWWFTHCVVERKWKTRLEGRSNRGSRECWRCEGRKATGGRERRLLNGAACSPLRDVSRGKRRLKRPAPSALTTALALSFHYAYIRKRWRWRQRGREAGILKCPRSV